MSKPGYLTDDELKLLWPQLNEWIEHGDKQHRRMAQFIGTLLATGMRVSELCKLELDRCITAPQPVIWLPPKTTKTKKGRWVGIFPAFRPQFIDCVEEKKQEGETFLFRGRAKWKPLSRITAWHWWTRVLKEVGIGPREPYRGGTRVARRTFATWMPHIVFATPQGPQRMNSEQLSQTLGHSKDVMFAHYQEPTPGMIFPGDGSPEWVEFVGKEDNGEDGGPD